MTPRPRSEACERNRGPILEVLRDLLADCRSVLEIGSGTGQHAVHFAAALPHLAWQPSDLPENHAGIRAWAAHAALENLRDPLALDVDADPWPVAAADAVYTANTLHIVPWRSVEALLRGAARVLRPGGTLVVYGPFRYGGRHTSESNAHFDAFLRARDPASGIRDAAEVDRVAREAGFALAADLAMPANNRTRVWRRAVPS